MSCWDHEGLTSYIFEPDKSWQEQTPLALPPISENGNRFVAWSWSPDGRWLAGYVVTLPQDNPDGVAIYSLESQQYRVLTDFGVAPMWLADSRHMIFSHEGVLHRVDIESGSIQEILSVSPDRIFAGTTHDDQTLYFTRMTGEADIWMLTLN
jgi:hypothetical protein